MSIIELHPEDLIQASVLAAVQLGRRSTHGRSLDHGGASDRKFARRMTDGVIGFLGEIAVARLLNKAWTPGGECITLGDVGGELEVRATDWPSGHLLVYPSDPDDRWYVMAIVDFPQVRVVGGIQAGDAKARFGINPHMKPPCHWVPQDELEPIQ